MMLWDLYGGLHPTRETFILSRLSGQASIHECSGLAAISMVKRGAAGLWHLCRVYPTYMWYHQTD